MRTSKNWSFILLFSVVFVTAFYSCKKNHPTPEPEPTVTRTQEELVRDSIYYYFKLNSYWTEDFSSQLTKYSKISDFTNLYSSNLEVLRALKKLTPLFNYGDPKYPNIDRYSYFEDLVNGGNLASTKRVDNNEGYGLYTSYGTADNKTATPFIYYVEGGSPAFAAQLQRGDEILQIGETTDLSIPITCSNTGCEFGDQNRKNTVDNLINSALSNSSLKLKIKKENGTIVTKDLSFTTYAIDPIGRDTIISSGGKKIGYFMLSSFEETNRGSQNYNKHEALFEKFTQENITDLVVDLRYNGGGYVDAAIYLANKVINQAGDKQRMFDYDWNNYNDKRFKGKGGDSDYINFTKNNNLQLNHIYFLVSQNTASASELFINVLKPYYKEKHIIIADGTRTFGKPIGFFPQDILGKVNLWVASFKMVNAAGFTDYWLGLTPDKPTVDDYIFKNFGDPAETMFETAITHATTGSYTKSAKAARISTQSKTLHKTIESGVINKIPERELIKKH